MSDGSRDLVVTKTGARFLGRRLPCAIGRGGITHHKREGDGATPAGTYPVAAFAYFHRADRLNLKPGVPLRRHYIWSDDPADPRYNKRGVGAPIAHAPYGHERMWRPDALYDVVVDINHNRNPATPGHGSAIFIHQWRKPRHPTEGCIAFARDDLRWILQRIRWFDRLIIK